MDGSLVSQIGWTACGYNCGTKSWKSAATATAALVGTITLDTTGVWRALEMPQGWVNDRPFPATTTVCNCLPRLPRPLSSVEVEVEAP